MQWGVLALQHWARKTQLSKVGEAHKIQPRHCVSQKVFLAAQKHRLILHIVPVNVHVRKNGLEQCLLVDKLEADDDDSLDSVCDPFALHVDGCLLAYVDEA